MPRWRLVLDGACSAPWNIAVDEVLGERALEGLCTLRFYGWDAPSLLVPEGAPLSARRLRSCAAVGLDVMRCIGAGLAVLHGPGVGLDYTLAAPDAALPRGRATYERVAAALERALRALGAPVERETQRLPRVGVVGEYDCFGQAGADEIIAGGHKVCGSVQLRDPNVLLQTGTIRLSPNPPALLEAAGIAEKSATSLAELGVRTSREEVVAALCESFAAMLGPLDPGALTADERRRAGELARAKRRSLRADC